MKRILVTGGAGFIGSATITQLLSDKDNIIACVDNFDDAYDKVFKLDNISSFAENERFELYEVDIVDRENLDKVFTEFKLAESLKIALDQTQLNIGGERAIMSPDKLVLTGTQTDSNKRIVLKYATHKNGVDEIRAEHAIRASLINLPFAEQEVLMPEESFYKSTERYAVSVTAFIEQPKVFTDHSLKDQFFMAIHALEQQESFHVTTREHQSWIRDTFPRHTPDFYLNTYKEMSTSIQRNWTAGKSTLERGQHLLESNIELLRGYDGYLIHSDFVPHNFRIDSNQLYLLDFVSYRSGNKYELWARLINFMEIHSPELVTLLLEFVKEDRGKEEYSVLRLMRVYKISFLLNYYARTLTQTTGDLHELTKARLVFWTTCLEAILKDDPLENEVRQTYYKARDTFRTPEEKARQRQFTWA